MEWTAQILVIGAVLDIEGLNTALEKLRDYQQPDFNKKNKLYKGYFGQCRDDGFHNGHCCGPDHIFTEDFLMEGIKEKLKTSSILKLYFCPKEQVI